MYIYIYTMNNDAMNGLNKQSKATSVSAFDFSTLYIKLPHNNLTEGLRDNSE